MLVRASLTGARHARAAMDPISAITGMIVTAPVAAIQRVAAVRMLQTDGALTGPAKTLLDAAQQTTNRLANLAEGIGRNLDITV